MTFFEGGVHVLTFVGGGYVPQSQRGTSRDELIHGSDWLPTIIGLTNTASIETISNDLKMRLYTPIAKQVAIKKENTTDNYLKYLVGESFDGIDLSQWLLYGDRNDNPRTNVGLSINSLSSFNNSVAIVFESDLTGHRYKFIYLAEISRQNAGYCTFCYHERTGVKYRCEISDTTEDVEFIFDLTIDFNETTNLLTNISQTKNLHLENNNETYKFEIKHLADYKKNANQGLVQFLWDEAKLIIYEYQQNALFNNFLDCQKGRYPEANPVYLDNAYSPFFAWKEYQSTFEQACDEYINDILLEMYLSY